MGEFISHIKKPELIAKRREQIISAAMDLFRKQGYYATTMRQICTASKVNRGSFYDYFSNKEDILVHIFKTKMYSSGDFKKTFAERHISGPRDLRPFIRHILNVSWNRNGDVIKLLFRETIALDSEFLRMVLNVESAYTKWLADNFRRGLKLPAVTKELEMAANSMAFFCSFVPLRGWNMRDLDKTELLDFITDMLMARLKILKSEFRKKQKQPSLESKHGNT
ncbi:MAG: TetR/AcrR family transcriptional regulator [Deltaproteobacteria bacterium]|nr:TetR/AcrR family transcriptional regulator [Deltaproteobacteria bacterium]